MGIPGAADLVGGEAEGEGRREKRLAGRLEQKTLGSRLRFGRKGVVPSR